MRARRAPGIMVILVGLLLAGGLPTAQAGNYLGEFCWQSTDGGVAKFAVTDMGGGHFLLNGKIIKPGGVIQEVANGNAEVVGSQIYMAVTSIGSGQSGTWGSLSRIVDLATLNGSLEGLGVEHSMTNLGPFGNYMQLYYDGVQALTFVRCP